jgi:hypothetical protein
MGRTRPLALAKGSSKPTQSNSPLVHQQALREDGECPAWIVPSVSPKRVRRNSYMVSIPPFSLGTASGEFLRPAASCLLLFRFLPKTLRAHQRGLLYEGGQTDAPARWLLRELTVDPVR